MNISFLNKQKLSAASNAAQTPSGYILVQDPNSKDQQKTAGDDKTPLSAVFKLAVSRHLKASRDPVRVRLVGEYAATSAAATALTSVQALSPISVSDYSSFAAVYDLWRVQHVKVHVRCGSSGAINGAADWGLAWDPVNIGPYTGVGDIMTAKSHIGPFVIGGTIVLSPSSYTKSGFHELSAKLIPTRVTNDSTAANAVGGGWVGSSDTTAVIGWLKPYVGSLGAGVTSTLVYYVTYDVEFKSRT